MIPVKVALTGGIGSGKSYIADICKRLEIPVFESDIEAKKLYLNPEVINFVYTNISRDAVNCDGSINFIKLASVIFNDKSKLNILNNYIHPKVMDIYLEWSSNQKSQYTINESAIIFENDLTSYFDYIITVIADVDIRVSRALSRDGNATQDDIIRRINNQVNDAHRLKNSDFIIENNSNNLIIPQIIKINEKIILK